MIAARLGLSISTVDVYRVRAYRKLFRAGETANIVDAVLRMRGRDARARRKKPDAARAS